MKEDAARGTIYLPQEDMKRFGYNEPDLLKSVHNPDFVRLMRFEGARAKELYAQALQNLPAISRPLARPALVMGRIYRVLLKKIEQADYNVFAGRISLTPWEKMRCVGKVLWEEWSK
ncbi:MAG: squalene/phytoene synthase family protein [Elusimicrobia bacterium]|nr:squalene/phytoene synthase family protein [Elusimicrobiota bacterium]